MAYAPSGTCIPDVNVSVVTMICEESRCYSVLDCVFHANKMKTAQFMCASILRAFARQTCARKPRYPCAPKQDLEGKLL